MRWPLAIFLCGVFVVAVNFTYIYVAISGADAVDPAYTHGPR